MKREKIFLGLMVLIIVLLLNVETRGAEFTMRTAEIFREGFTHSECQKHFAKRVGEITKGKAEVKVFLGAVLGQRDEITVNSYRWDLSILLKSRPVTPSPLFQNSLCLRCLISSETSIIFTRSLILPLGKFFRTLQKNPVLLYWLTGI